MLDVLCCEIPDRLSRFRAPPGRTPGTRQFNPGMRVPNQRGCRGPDNVVAFNSICRCVRDVSDTTDGLTVRVQETLAGSGEGFPLAVGQRELSRGSDNKRSLRGGASQSLREGRVETPQCTSRQSAAPRRRGSNPKTRPLPPGRKFLHGAVAVCSRTRPSAGPRALRRGQRRTRFATPHASTRLARRSRLVPTAWASPETAGPARRGERQMACRQLVTSRSRAGERA